jgi:hypothetical protein
VRPGRAALAVALATLIACIALPGGASAQRRDPSIRLASQTPWVGRGDLFQLRLFVDTASRSDLEVTVAVHRPITSRSDFARTLEGRVQGTAFKTQPAPLDELPPDAGGARPVVLGIQDPALPRDSSRLSLRGEGVYPVRVELSESGGGDVLDSFVTHLVYLPDPVDAPRLSVAWVAPVHAAPALRPNGTRRLDPAAAAGLSALAAQLEPRPELPVTLLPTPETLDGLAASTRAGDRETLARLVTVAQRPVSQVVASPYVPVALPALSSSLASERTAQLATGTGVDAATLQDRPDPRVRVVDGPLTEAALDGLRAEQVDRVVVPEDTLTPITLQVTLAQPFELSSRGGGQLDAAVADPGLARHFRAGSNPALAAHQLLADLAVVWFDSPARERGVVVVPPRRWRPVAEFLEPFLDGLARSPLLEAVTLDGLFDDVPQATSGRSGGRTRPLVRSLPARPDAGGALPASAIEAVRRRLDAFSAILEPGEPVFERMQRTLLVAQSADLRASQRQEYLRGVGDQITAELDGIVGPSNRSITLTARRGRVPITVRKDVSYPVRLVVRVDSDQLRVVGSRVRQLELTRRNTTELFTVQARTSGAFPLRVTLESPDGRLVLSTSRFTVRSTAASGVGVILSIGAGWVLLVWWIRHGLRRRRRARRAN